MYRTYVLAAAVVFKMAAPVRSLNTRSRNSCTAPMDGRWSWGLDLLLVKTELKDQ
jgi:hypothetical protein